MQTSRIFDIADVLFSQVSEEEKKLYMGNVRENGSYQGYKLKGFWVSTVLAHNGLRYSLVNAPFYLHSTSIMAFMIRLRTIAVGASSLVLSLHPVELDITYRNLA